MRCWPLLLVLGSSLAHAELTPIRLRCEYIEEPRGIDSKKPRLSWRLASAQRAQWQKAYRIVVSSRLEWIAGEKGDLWDSGRVESSNSLQVAYEGLPLRSRQRCFWKVRVWDQDGTPSAWSEAGSWSMGLLREEDWAAAWIGHAGQLPASRPARNGFHAEFTSDRNREQWVALDLKRTQRVTAIRLFPARPFDWQPDTPGFLFPLRFRIETSETPHFTNATVVLDQTVADVPNPGTNAPIYQTAPGEARFVRVVVTSCRARETNRFAFALAELQVLSASENVAAGAQVTASSSVETLHWSAAFLTDGDLVSHAGSAPDPQPGTYLRKEFEVEQPIVRATLYASALGLYQVFINGTRVGNASLAPDWTDYRTRVQYQTFDVTEQLRAGLNAVGAVLGEGWYAGRTGMSDGLIGIRRGVYGSKPLFLAQLEIELASGPRVVVGTDGSWRSSREGPVRRSDILDGELQDARRQATGWASPSFTMTNWNQAEARTIQSAEARLVSQINEPVRDVQSLAAVALTEPRPGLYVFDLGQNLVGRCQIRVAGPSGTAIQLRHGEMLEQDGTVYAANLRGAAQTDEFILRGEGMEFFEPFFTYHGFRYVEVAGLREKPALNALSAVAFHSAAREVGAFECSDPALNQLWTNIVWTLRGNLTSVPTDCPQRDERLGWMGDIGIFAQTAMFQMDLAAFFTKFVQDIRDAQAKDGRFPDFAPHPYDPNRRFSGAPGWADAGVMIPWRCYINYADRRMIEEHFDAACRWIEFIRERNPDLIWRQHRGNDYNDWLNGDNIVKAGWPTTGASVPKELFATAFFAHSTDLVSRMARVLEKKEEERKYRAWFEDIRRAFNRTFVGQDGTLPGDTQAGYALALNFDLLSKEASALALDRFIAGIRARDNHLSTGIQSTHRAMLELSRRGHADMSWLVLTNRTFPSWLYMIDNGATTIWERWDGYVKGRGFQSPGMNSFNHWAFGAVGEWMFRNIIGLSPDEEHPGYRQFIVEPHPGGGVTWARGKYESHSGPIGIDWRIEGGRMQMHLSVPANTRARLRLPCAADALEENGSPLGVSHAVRTIGRTESGTTWEVPSGEYNLSCPWRY